jgi:HK97 family phage portal protein
MSWWDRYVWSRLANREALTLEQLLADEGRPTAAGEPVTTDSALRLSTVWGCIRLISDTVSTLPIAVFRGDERDPLALPAVLRQPSADFGDFHDWCWAVMASLLTRGNAWGVITARAGASLRPVQVDLVDPGQVAVTTDRDGRRIIRVGGVEYDRADLFHVRGYPWPGQLEGMAPLERAREAIGLGLGAEKYGARFFGDSAIPSGYLYSDHEVKEEKAKHVKAVWQQAHKGRREVAVLGGVKFEAVTIPNDQAQFIETQRFSVSTICRFFGVPAGMMAGSELAGHEDYSSPEMRAVDFLQFTLRPWLHRVERAISGQLLPRGQAAKFNAGGLLRPTLRERYEAHRIGIEAGFLTRNEVRELEDRPPLPEPAAGRLGVVA